MDIRSCSESQTHGGSISPENWSGTRDVDNSEIFQRSNSFRLLKNPIAK